MQDSYLSVDDRNRVMGYIGPDAVQLFRVRTIISGLEACKKGFRLTCNATPKNLMKMTTALTGKKYKLTEYDRAIEDLRVWASNMQCALPVVDNKGEVK